MAFFQEPPRLLNQFAEDEALRGWLSRAVPREAFDAMEPSLEEMGELAAGPLHELAVRHRCDEPRYIGWDAWGRRIDRIEVNEAWKEYARVAARDGLVATAYERKLGAYSRVHQFALVYLFAPSSQTYSCPLAMTDGCARTIELIGSDELKATALSHLISRDPEQAWTSGQWMTERTGGSDVGLSETVARQDEAGRYRLYGTKWFTSAITSEVTLTLARPEGNPPGGKGLALFFAHLRDAEGRLNHISVNRLKDKLGTRHLPTAELSLDGMIAEPVAGLRDGVKNMGSMLNITRMWNAVSAVAGMRRGLALARDYARKRVAFGAPLSQKPLHLETLAGLSAQHEAALQITFFGVALLGRVEVGEATDEERALLRSLTPIIKLFTARAAVQSASEVLECFGGAGYVEDTGLPQLLRDAQVLSIWEGTTNVLSLDTLRALVTENGWDPLRQAVRRHAEPVTDSELSALGQHAVAAVDHALDWAAEAGARSRPEVEAGAREFALTLGRALSLALLVEQGQWSLDRGDRRCAAAARRFAACGIDTVGRADYQPDDARALALGEPLG